MKLQSGTSLLAVLIATTASSASECGHTEYGWTYAVGGDEFETARSACFLPDGGLVVAGFMEGSFDFDPTKKKDVKRSKGRSDAVVTRLDGSGGYNSTFRVGGTGFDYSRGVAAIADGGFVTVGGFENKVDFDPSRSKDKHKADSRGDVFISWYTASGEYRRTRTFGGDFSDGARGVAVDRDGNAIVVGFFRHAADFDPGRGKGRRTAVGGDDVFISKFDEDGNYLWARTSGGEGDDKAFGVALDSQGDIVVTGYFRGLVDFDPGPGIDLHESQGREDAFITKLGVDGSYHWTHTFGGTDLQDWGISATVDETDNVYVTGSFRGIVDFDRRGDSDVRVSKGFTDIFVTSRAPDGAYRWTAHMGGPDLQGGNSVALDPALDQIVVVGPFSDVVDFDPGEGVDERRSVNEGRDAFVTWLTLDGGYVGTETFGGTGSEVPRAVAVGADSSVVVGGFYNSSDADFDPTSGVDQRGTHGEDDIFVTRLYCGPCDVVEGHSLTGKRSKIIGTLRALAPDGRATVECTGPGDPIETHVDIDPDSNGSYKLKNLDPGEYTCTITEVRDADGRPVCDAPAGVRAVRVE